VCCRVLQHVGVSVAVCCSVLQCIAVCCSVLQCVAVCCSVLQCAAQDASIRHDNDLVDVMSGVRCVLQCEVCVAV